MRTLLRRRRKAKPRCRRRQRGLSTWSGRASAFRLGARFASVTLQFATQCAIANHGGMAARWPPSIRPTMGSRCLTKRSLHASAAAAAARCCSGYAPSGTSTVAGSGTSIHRRPTPARRPASISPGVSPRRIERGRSSAKSRAAVRIMPGPGLRQAQSRRQGPVPASGW